jgi:hypothetical protein
MEAKMKSSVIPKFLLLALAAGWAASGSAQASSCVDQWPVATVHTIGKGQAPAENPKVIHAITGNIVDPTSVAYTADRITVCAGTSVKAMVTDHTGTPTNTASTTGITCTDSGCSAVGITEKQEYVSRSADGGDTDRVTLIPE